MRGGQENRNADGRRRHVRAIRSVNEDIRLNRALWQLTETLAEQTPLTTHQQSPGGGEPPGDEPDRVYSGLVAKLKNEKRDSCSAGQKASDYILNRQSAQENHHE